ncbi:MAG TPA: substrate-binding domain-containing protein [Lautropia sp.]|nr:substrate-binding domain-containing protein [Lautropia sp.]
MIATPGLFFQPACAETPADSRAARDSIVMASTTSTEQSGLFSYLIPRLTAATGVDVRVVAVGTGQALDLARRGDADVLLVHDPAAEEKLVEEGYGVARREIMYNDFVIVGPGIDPAGITGSTRAADALARVARARLPFVSRGDRSGTHAAELRLWKEAGVAPPASGTGWYQESGSGMGPTLNIASARGAYTLTDRATWLNFKNRGDLTILVHGDPVLFNRYSVILTSERKHPHVKAQAAAKVADWLASGEGQATIGGYRLNGEPLFVPNAARRPGPAE